MSRTARAVVGFTVLFPYPARPLAGLFVRERMLRLSEHFRWTVVVPVPWFPFQAVIRHWRPHFRPEAPRRHADAGLEILYPRFFSFPGLFKFIDAWSIALCTLPLMLRLKRSGRLHALDAHFAYPDGYAATLLGRWLNVPVAITLRGTEVSMAEAPLRRRLMLSGLRRATQIFSVAESLKRHVVALGIPPQRILVVGNGVDTFRFSPIDKGHARRKLALCRNAKVLVSVGGLVERKGMHRVIECLPRLRQQFPDLKYLIAGGGTPEGDWTSKLQQLAAELGLSDAVVLLGPVPPDELKVALSAADVFVLATRNEGWANVFLEAMACGLPVVTTSVGGNAQVVCKSEYGMLVPFGDSEALTGAIGVALTKEWDRDAIIEYARANSWEQRIAVLNEQFLRLTRPPHQCGSSSSLGAL